MEIENAHGWYMRQRELGWQRHFAWLPVNVDVSTSVWLQWVERRITGLNRSDYISSATWEYRRIGETGEGWPNH